MPRPGPAPIAVVLLVALSLAPGAVSAEPPPDLSSDAEAQGFADLFFAGAMVELADKDYASALPMFERAASTWPKDATYPYFAAICKLRLGRLDEAIASLRATLPPAANRVAESRVRYDIGEAQYRKGDLPEAEKELRASLRLDDGDAWAHYYLGLTLFASNRAEEAFRHFDRARSLDRTLGVSGAYYLGIAAYQRGNAAEARARFEEVLAQAPGPELSASSRLWIGALDSAKAEAPAPPRGEIRVGVAAEWDDNPAQLSDVFTLPGYGSDRRGVLRLRAATQPWIQANGAVLGLVLNGYASRHDDFDQLDLDGAEAVAQLAWGADPLGYANGPLGYARTSSGADRIGFLVQAGSSYFDMAGDSFRRDHSAAGSFFVHEGGFGKTQVDVLWDEVHFFDPFFLSGQNGHELTFGASQYFFLGAKPDRYVRAGLSHGSSTAENDSLGRDADTALVEVAVPICGHVTAFAYGSRSKENYDTDFVFRDVNRTEWAASVVVGLGSHLYATLRYSRLKRDVDPDFYSFERKIGSAGITWYW